MKVLIALFSIFVLILAVPTAFIAAAPYKVDHSKSSITFSGIHAGNKFEGKFEKWDAEIEFDQNNLAASFIKTTFDPASAKTGNALYDGTLPQVDWFSVKDFAQAKFESKSISALENGGYKADGILTIRDKALPVRFDFTLSDLSQSPVIATATLKVDRLAYDIGKKSDPKAEWVSQNIDITLSIVAVKQ